MITVALFISFYLVDLMTELNYLVKFTIISIISYKNNTKHWLIHFNLWVRRHTYLQLLNTYFWSEVTYGESTIYDGIILILSYLIRG